MGLVLSTLMAYFFGSVLFGQWIARLRGINLFKRGTGRPDALNAAKVLGLRWGALVAVLDCAKGFVIVLAVSMLESNTALAVPALVLGHMFPPFKKFRGGEPSAPLFGAALFFSWLAPLWALVWLIVLWASHSVWIACSAACLAFGIVMFVLGLQDVGLAFLFIAVVVLAQRAVFSAKRTQPRPRR